MWDDGRRGLVEKALISYMYVEVIAIQIMEPKKDLSWSITPLSLFMYSASFSDGVYAPN
jgi:hypothetical protein